MHLTPGMMVTGNVRLARPLGEGAMGCVWVADHLTLNTEVAVKFISAELPGDDGEVRERFVREASMAAQIKSPHVVQTFDQGLMSDGTPYIVMELLEGESLQQRLERGGRLDLAQVAQIVFQVSRALAKAHRLGIVHRDIKPDNIFLTPSDDGLFCKVFDFGIAKHTQLPQMGGLTNPGMMVGTPEYMSPEQVLSAKDVDYQADLWGLAVTAYVSLTAELPFYAEALGTLCVKLLDGRFAPPSTHRAELSPEVDGWFGRAMAQHPDERFGSAREMAQSLLQLASASQPGLYEELSYGALTPTPDPAYASTMPPAPGDAEELAGSPYGAISSPVVAAKSRTLSGSAATKRPLVRPKSRLWMALSAGAIAGLGVVALTMSPRGAQPAVRPGALVGALPALTVATAAASAPTASGSALVDAPDATDGRSASTGPRGSGHAPRAAAGAADAGSAGAVLAAASATGPAHSKAVGSAEGSTKTALRPPARPPKTVPKTRRPPTPRVPTSGKVKRRNYGF